MKTTDQAGAADRDTFLEQIDEDLVGVFPFQRMSFDRSDDIIFLYHTPICSLFRVKAMASAEDNSNTSYIIDVETHNGRVTEVIVPNALLTRNAPAALEIMAD